MLLFLVSTFTLYHRSWRHLPQSRSPAVRRHVRLPIIVAGELRVNRSLLGQVRGDLGLPLRISVLRTGRPRPIEEHGHAGRPSRCGHDRIGPDTSVLPKGRRQRDRSFRHCPWSRRPRPENESRSLNTVVLASRYRTTARLWPIPEEVAELYEYNGSFYYCTAW